MVISFTWYYNTSALATTQLSEIDIGLSQMSMNTE